MKNNLLLLLLPGFLVLFQQCSENAKPKFELQPGEYQLLDSIPLTERGKLTIRQEEDTAIFDYHGYSILQPLNNDSLLIMRGWAEKCKLVDSRKFTIDKEAYEVRKYISTSGEKALLYFVDDYGLIANNPYGIPSFFDRGFSFNRTLITMLSADSTGFFRILMVDENLMGSNSDTIRYYWRPDLSIYSFDTVLNRTAFHMKAYCLNDSAVFNETWSERRSKDGVVMEYSVAHNYAADFTITDSNKNKTKLRITKESFKDSLSQEFVRICHMWKNEFSHCSDGKLIFGATLSIPDTDAQVDVLYSISDKGKFNIIKVVPLELPGILN